MNNHDPLPGFVIIYHFFLIPPTPLSCKFWRKSLLGGNLTEYYPSKDQKFKSYRDLNWGLAN